MKPHVKRAFQFLKNLRGPKQQRLDVKKLAMKSMDREMLALFNQFARSFFQKKGVKMTKEQDRVANTMTYFMALGYLLKSMEGPAKPPKATTVRSFQKRNPTAV